MSPHPSHHPHMDMSPEAKKARVQNSMRILKDEPVPEGYIRFRWRSVSLWFFVLVNKTLCKERGLLKDMCMCVLLLHTAYALSGVYSHHDWHDFCMKRVQCHHHSASRKLLCHWVGRVWHSSCPVWPQRYIVVMELLSLKPNILSSKGKIVKMKTWGEWRQ
jgi:hypothetical protein